MITTLLFDYIRVLYLPSDQPVLPASDSQPLNFALLDFIRPLQSSYELHIFTSGHVPADPTLRQHLEPLFKRIFTTTHLGLPKSNPEVFRVIARELAIQAEEILFIDDTRDNVMAAQQAGLAAIQYITLQQTKQAISQALQEN